jgi:hypothetical protein
MDDIERLIIAFGSRGKSDHILWKIDILLDLVQYDDSRVISFLLAVVIDADEPTDVRRDALGRLRQLALTPEQRVQAAEASRQVLTGHAPADLRLQAALVLGDVVDVEGVLTALGAVAQDTAEPIELRYNAFTSLQRAGPTTECLAVLRTLSRDEALGRSAQAVISAWGAR